MDGPSFHGITFPWKILSGLRPIGVILTCAAFYMIPESILDHMPAPTLE